MSRISRRGMLMAACGGLAGARTWAGKEIKRQGNTVIDIEESSSLLPAEKVSFSTQPLRDAPMPVRAPKAPAEEPCCVRHFGNNSANSRLPGVLPNGAWNVKWAAALAGEGASVIRCGNRILCQWSGEWRLFDEVGKTIAGDYCGRSPVVIDERSHTFQLITDALGWEVRDLSTGAMSFQNALPYNESYSWSVLLRSGTRYLAFANVQPPFDHGKPEKSSALLQMIELNLPLDLSASLLVKNLKQFETLKIAAEGARAAAVNGNVTMAGPDVLMRFEPDLHVASAFTGTFTPLQISLDDSGWTYLLTKTESGRRLWTITPEGQRVANQAAPQDFGEVIQPPIVGYDGRMYLLSTAQLAALSSDGQLLWVKSLPGSGVGAGVTVDGKVLVTLATALLAFSPEGEYHELRRFEETVGSPPIITSHREILLSAGKKLYCLAT